MLDELTAAGLDPERLHAQVLDALTEDLPAPEGSPAGTWGVDATSAATLDPAQRGTADLAAREPGTVAGLAVAELVLRTVLGDDVEVHQRVPDGTRVAAGDVVLRASGPVPGLLTAERTALNYASHLSGVATTTARWVEAVAGTGARVLDTRKTLPGWRALQKYAVRCGGGVNHRLGLSDMVMVKDNHVVAAGGVVPAYEAVRAAWPDLRVEVEVTDLDQLRALLEVGCDHVLLDNMDTATMVEAVRVAAGRATLEASGGLTLDRAREVAATGVDFLSVGALTHSVAVLDLGLDLQETPLGGPA
ncbi:carboxylating nicotinate-nucleotide diphosphorylase [Nocardioides perillae]|uniref:carboxylating nicotinate-nucleotide diphosphorylase n=1 Tax=Nocardioides perillae TaxID=1119534 RepID=UPI0015CD6EA0